MAWLKIDDRVRTHPKIVEAGPVAAWFWFCGICYCREHLTDGFIADKMLSTLVPGAPSWKRPAAALVAAGLWHREERGYRVHDFLEWNPSRAEVEAQRAADRQRKGAGIQPDSNRNPVGTTQDSSRTRDAHTGSGSLSVSAQALSGSLEGVSGEPTPIRKSGPIRHPSPLEWDRVHGRHTVGFCDWFCLPADVFGQLATRLGGEAEAMAFAKRVRARFESSVPKGVPSGRPWEFWERQLAIEFPPEAAPSRTPDALSGVREALRRV